MGKKSKFALLGALIATTGGVLAIGDKLYKMSGKSIQHEEGKDHDPAVTGGRLWIRNHPERRDIYIDAIDNIRLHAVYLEAEEKTEKTMICIHGTFDNLEGVGIFAKHFHEEGYNVLMPDLRGFGKSEGEYAGYGVDDRLDIMQWIYWLIRRNPAVKIGILGTSMGAATTLMVTGEHLPENVLCAVADSSYTSVEEEFADVYHSSGRKFPPAKPFVQLARAEIKARSGFDIRDGRPIDAVTRSVTPTLFLHGEADELIPPSACQRLYDAAACPKEYCTFLNAGHIDGVWVEPQKYWNKVDEFLKKYGM